MSFIKADSLVMGVIDELENGLQSIVKDFIENFTLNSLAKKLNVDRSKLMKSRSKSVKELSEGDQTIFEDVVADGAFKVFIGKFNEIYKISNYDCVGQMNDLMMEVANDVADIKQKLNTQDMPKQMEANIESNEDQVDLDSESMRSYSKVVRASLEATMPKWKFNLLLTVKGHSKFFNEIVATKPGMINMLSEFGDIKMDDMESVSLLYSG